MKVRMGDFLCADCGLHTSHINEYYMVHSKIWREFVPENKYDTMLCIGCLEKRMDRKLIPKDFKDCLLNDEGFSTSRSNRLLTRMGYKKIKKK